MRVPLPLLHYGLPVAASGAGAVVTSFTGDPSGLLIAVAAVCLCGGAWIALVLAPILGLALGVSLLAGATEVQDHGTGLNEFQRIFEPFTTRKQGMGMGLAICRSIIESHDGRLWAAANEPRGTTLALTLPVRARDAA